MGLYLSGICQESLGEGPRLLTAVASFPDLKLYGRRIHFCGSSIDVYGANQH
jgi:hypothetical protein